MLHGVDAEALFHQGLLWGRTSRSGEFVIFPLCPGPPLAKIFRAPCQTLCFFFRLPDGVGILAHNDTLPGMSACTIWDI